MDGAPFTGRVRIPGAGLLVRAARRPPDRRPRRPRSADEAAISGERLAHHRLELSANPFFESRFHLVS